MTRVTDKENKETARMIAAFKKAAAGSGYKLEHQKQMPKEGIIRFTLTPLKQGTAKDSLIVKMTPDGSFKPTIPKEMRQLFADQLAAS